MRCRVIVPHIYTEGLYIYILRGYITCFQGFISGLSGNVWTYCTSKYNLIFRRVKTKSRRLSGAMSPSIRAHVPYW